MTRQSEHQAKRAREGYRKVQFLATPPTVAALAQLRARGAKSDAQAVNAAILASAGYGRLGKAVTVPIWGSGEWVFDIASETWSKS